MQNNANNFVAMADIAVADQALRQAVAKGTHLAYTNRIKAMYSSGHDHGERLRQQAAAAKRRALSTLPDLLEQAEQNLLANGIQVLWAEDAAEACEHVLNIARQHQTQSVIKSKSMLTEEIGLNHVLIQNGLRVVETDLGEYILQLNDEAPSHIVAPVIHKSKADIKAIFQRKLNMPDVDDAESLVMFAREKLRADFVSADMGISGGNFVIATTGTLGLLMNEGNGRMVTTLPRVHVAVVGIEKVVENLDDYALLTQVLPRSGTGQTMTVYTNMINGPCDDGGPQHIYVVFVDNGRSQIYANETYAEALACIRCGACQNACPVYRSTGGHAYGWVYGGPIGAVLTPLLTGLEQAIPLPYASSLCGACKAVCPVDIDIPRLLLALRHELIQQDLSDSKWAVGIKGWELVNRSPQVFEWAGKMAAIGLNLGLERALPSPLGTWKQQRDFPGFAPISFRQQWRQQQKERRHESD